MQTFLPYKTFSESLSCLDTKRLGKQRVEARQILNVHLGRSTGWRHHPAVRMWQGYEDALEAYHNIAIRLWIKRGYVNNMKLTFDFLERGQAEYRHPTWLTDEFCLSHRSNLIRKYPEWYRDFWPDVPNDLPYIWPV